MFRNLPEKFARKVCEREWNGFFLLLFIPFLSIEKLEKR